jgi:hypothetical protein
MVARVYAKEVLCLQDRKQSNKRKRPGQNIIHKDIPPLPVTYFLPPSNNVKVL